jgi:diaminopimelate epimerase
VSIDLNGAARIRPMGAGDIGDVIELAWRIWNAHYPGIITRAQIDYMLAQRYSPDRLRSELQDPDIAWSLAESPAGLVGFASTHRDPRSRNLKIDKLYVDPASQRRGIGRLLLESARAEAIGAGCRQLVLAVNRHNIVAIRAYQRFGFRVREARKSPIGAGFVMDDFIMAMPVEVAPEHRREHAMKLRFTKMQGLGNDFVVIDGVNQSVNLSADEVRRIADRHFGIGCDQLLLVERPSLAGADFRYRIFNADGGEVEQCGNGARCFVRFVHEQGLSDRRELTVETRRGLIRPRLEDDGSVSVDMGQPEMLPEQVPFLVEDGQPDAVVHRLDVGGEVLLISVVSMGNPHAVVVVDNVDTAPVARLGPLIEGHRRFPERVNAGFMAIGDRQRIRLRVYERGAGETLACGTGACAAVVSGVRRGLLDSPVRVTTRGGELTIAWAGEGRNVIMNGPATTVFEGEIDIGERT